MSLPKFLRNGKKGIILLILFSLLMSFSFLYARSLDNGSGMPSDHKGLGYCYCMPQKQACSPCYLNNGNSSVGLDSILKVVTVVYHLFK